MVPIPHLCTCCAQCTRESCPFSDDSQVRVPIVRLCALCILVPFVPSVPCVRIGTIGTMHQGHTGILHPFFTRKLSQGGWGEGGTPSGLMDSRRGGTSLTTNIFSS